MCVFLVLVSTHTQTLLGMFFVYPESVAVAAKTRIRSDTSVMKWVHPIFRQTYIFPSFFYVRQRNMQATDIVGRFVKIQPLHRNLLDRGYVICIDINVILNVDSSISPY